VEIPNPQPLQATIKNSPTSHPNNQHLIKSKAMAEQKMLTVTATYASPANEAFGSSIGIPAPPTDSVADKTQYLAALREAIAATQAQINKELTQRMEEDNARADGTKIGAVKAVDEDKEEENYGEEVQEEED
jgi:hypothetical protein